MEGDPRVSTTGGEVARRSGQHSSRRSHWPRRLAASTADLESRPRSQRPERTPNGASGGHLRIPAGRRARLIPGRVPRCPPRSAASCAARSSLVVHQAPVSLGQQRRRWARAPIMAPDRSSCRSSCSRSRSDRVLPPHGEVLKERLGVIVLEVSVRSSFAAPRRGSQGEAGNRRPD